MKKKDPRYWEVKERKIVVILFEETKEFFVNDTTQESLWRYYDEHFRGRVSTTRNHFEERKKTDLLPPMFHICDVTGTCADSFKRKMEVVKYFMDYGYTSLVKGELLAAVEEFTEWDECEYYLSIRNIPVEIMYAPEKNLFPDFRKTGKNIRTGKSQLPPHMYRIPLVVHEEEYKKFKRMAEKYNTSMSEYILECTRNGGLIQLDTTFMEKYARTMDDCYDLLKGILVSILISQNYFPADITRLETIKHEMAKINSEASADMARFYRNFTRIKNGKKITEDQLE